MIISKIFKDLMRKYFVLLLVVLLSSSSIVKAQSNNSNHSVFLASNMVDINNTTGFTAKMEEILSEQTESFTFIINGDLVNSKFKKNFKKDSIRITSLFTRLSQFKNGTFIIVPGDRDWDGSGKHGLSNVKKLERLIKSLKLKNVKWSVKKGCPGPKEFVLDENLLLITIDTQWWNHPFDVPGPIDGDCKVSTTDDFKEEFEDIINENPDKNIIIAGHHPIISNGEYGGHLPFYKHIFPLTDLNENLYLPIPLLGSFYPSFRENIGNSDDIVNERFDETRKLLHNILNDYNSLIYVSGHEKTQQILEVNGNYFVNSGAPQNAQHAANIDGSTLSESEPGVIELIYHSDGKVTSVFHQFKKSNKNKKTHFTLFESACKYHENQLLVNYSFIPCEEVKSTKEKMAKKYPKSIKVVAGPEYEAGSLKRFFMGAHYRDSWTAKVEVPYLNLDTTKGGLTVLKKGGGRQTLSLKFQGGDGIRYAFRSVNKDPIKALDYDLRKTAIANIVKDQTTTQHPYGAMAADILLNELDIIHAHPKLFVMPNDPKLGPFQEDFGNMLGMLEENPSNPEDGETGYLGANQIVRSNKLFRKLYNDHNNQIDTKNFAVARAFDILVGDWGKHDDNWKWVGFENNGRTIFKPMPRDRDHVFSRWDGVLPWLADREWAKESGEDFNYEISGLRSLMFQARHLDRFIASDLSKQNWLDAAKFVQTRITDEVIEDAIQNMPPEIYTISGQEIENKLKARIKDLDKYVLEYYDMISSEVDIVGSNLKEYFHVIRNNDGSVHVKVYNVKNKSMGDNLLYSRTFFKDETEDIRLYGLGGRDVFDIEGDTEESIQLRIISGSGKDSINDVSNALTLIYDKGKKTKLNKDSEAKIIKPDNESLCGYDRTRFAYNTYFLLPYAYYGADDGFIFSLGVDFVNHNYDKEDYSVTHNIKASISTNRSYGIGYIGRFHHVFSGWDFLLSGNYDDPLPYTYFYGFGNETTKDDEKYSQNYYRTRYSSKGISAGLIYDYWKTSNISLKINYENNEKQQDIENTIFESDDFIGINKSNIIEGVVGLDLDFRNHSTLPTSGMRLLTEYRSGFLMNLNNEYYGKFWAVAEGYLSFQTVLPFTFGIRAGGGSSFGEIPFYHQLTLGQNTYLKGYRNNRFTGTSIVFMQSELRINLFEFDKALVPMKIGVLGFFNTGKIFQRNEDSKKWHNGYGLGLFVVPLRKDFTLHTIFGFSEEESLLFEFGFGSAL